jgi:flagellar basal-body rod protein FlgG
MRSLNIAATGMLAQQLNVEVISNNIANLNTTGFKRSRAEFQDLLYQNEKRIGTSSSDAGTTVPSGVQVGLGVQTGSIYRIHEQGNLLPTNNSLDLAIQGEGYFQINLANNGTAYTRAGQFQLNETGQIVTPDGLTLQGPGAVPPNATAVTVNSSGEVLATIPGSTTPSNLGQIQLATFINNPGLESIGNNLYTVTQASGPANQGTPGTNQFGTVLQGFLETSNVNVVSEITNLITAQRAYEMNSRVIEASDQMLTTISQLR